MSKPAAAAAAPASATAPKAADKLKAHVDSHMQTKFAHIDEQKEKSVMDAQCRARSGNVEALQWHSGSKSTQ